jgi:hypothetical protein
MSDAAASPATPDPPDLVAVPILRIPVAIWAETQQHIDELLREFTLMAAQLRERPDQSHDVPQRLVQLVDELTENYGGLNIDQENRLAAAAESGIAEIDLVYQVPPGAASAVGRLQAMLDEADAYCRAGRHVLTLSTPPNLTRFRRWMLEEFVNQLDGAAPTPFPDYQG